MQAGAKLAEIADVELQALAHMERGWEVVRRLPAAHAPLRQAAE